MECERAIGQNGCRGDVQQSCSKLSLSLLEVAGFENRDARRRWKEGVMCSKRRLRDEKPTIAFERSEENTVKRTATLSNLPKHGKVLLAALAGKFFRHVFHLTSPAFDNGKNIGHVLQPLEFYNNR